MGAITPAKIRSANVYVETRFDAARSAVRTYYQTITRTSRPKTGRALYGHMLDLPAMARKAQSGGGYQFGRPSSRVYELISARHGMGLKMSVDDVADDMLGIYDERIELLGRRAAQFPDLGIWDLVVAGEATTLDGRPITCIDGGAFFATNHPYNPNKAEVGTFSNLKNWILSRNAFSAAYALMRSYKDAEGVPLNLMPTHLVVPPDLYTLAKEIVNATLVPTSGGSNVLQGMVEVVEVPYLSDKPTEWYLVSAEGETGKPLIYQVNEDPRLLSKTEEVRDDNIFYDDELVWLLKGRAEFGWGLPQRMIKGQGTQPHPSDAS